MRAAFGRRRPRQHGDERQRPLALRAGRRPIALPRRVLIGDEVERVVGDLERDADVEPVVRERLDPRGRTSAEQAADAAARRDERRRLLRDDPDVVGLGGDPAALAARAGTPRPRSSRRSRAPASPSRRGRCPAPASRTTSSRGGRRPGRTASSPHCAFAEGRPRRSGAWSTTSSWMSVAVWSSSTTQARPHAPRSAVARPAAPPAGAASGAGACRRRRRCSRPSPGSAATGESSSRRISASTASQVGADQRRATRSFRTRSRVGVATRGGATRERRDPRPGSATPVADASGRPRPRTCSRISVTRAVATSSSSSPSISPVTGCTIGIASRRRLTMVPGRMPSAAVRSITMRVVST